MMWSLGLPFHPQSPQARAIESLFSGFLVLAAVIFLVVTALVVYGIVRYRARAGAAEPPQVAGSRPVEIAWTAIPLVIVATLFVLTVRTMAFVDAPLNPTQPPDLVVTGRQWWWEARYPNGAVAVNEIHVPAGRRLLARIESGDVIHDFWVPELARKIDAVPGRPAYLWLEADRPGSYQGACSEFCGMQHAWMRFQVVAEAESDFSAWVNRQALAPPEPASGVPAEGARLFREKKCDECHAVSTPELTTHKGPPLTHVAGRRLLGGELANTRANLARWTAQPQSIKPGNHMTDQPLTAAETSAIAAYLETRQ